MKIKLLNRGGYFLPDEFEFPSADVSALRVSNGFLIVGSELNHLCGDEYFSDDEEYFFYPNECEVINEIKVGDLVTSLENECDEDGIVVRIDECDIGEPYYVYIYKYDFAVWCKESELTLKSPS